MNTNQKLISLYKDFCDAPGSDHISSEYAIKKLNEIIKYFGITNILEVGLGIGSISGILLMCNKNRDDFFYSGTEANEFCLESLAVNLKEDFNRLNIFEDLSTVPIHKKYDLIIVDGEDLQLENLVSLINKRGIIAIEGDRALQQEFLLKIFPFHKQVHCISLSKNQNYCPFPIGEWQGGLKIIFVNPTKLQYVWWLKERIFTKLKYQYPGRYLGSKKTKY